MKSCLLMFRLHQANVGQNMHSDFESLIHSSLEDICLTKNETIEMFVLFLHENMLC